jgi:hypothetical protein
MDAEPGPLLGNPSMNLQARRSTSTGEKVYDKESACARSDGPQTQDPQNRTPHGNSMETL